MDVLSKIVEAGRDKVEDEVMKNLFPDIEERCVKIKEAEDLGVSKNLPAGTSDNIKSEAEKQVKKTVDSLIQKVKELGSNYSLLLAGTTSLAGRIALIPAAVISATPVGPGVSASLIPTLLQQLKGEGDNLSKVYDDVKRLVEEIEESAGFIAIVAGVLGTVKGTMKAAKTACLLVGSPCDGEDAKTPEVKSPINVEYKAEDCKTYVADAEHTGMQPGTMTPWPKEFAYCTKFEATINKTVDDFTDDPEKGSAQKQYNDWLDGLSCSDCKNFKK